MFPQPGTLLRPCPPCGRAALALVVALVVALQGLGIPIHLALGHQGPGHGHTEVSGHGHAEVSGHGHAEVSGHGHAEVSGHGHAEVSGHDHHPHRHLHGLTGSHDAPRASGSYSVAEAGGEPHVPHSLADHKPVVAARSAGSASGVSLASWPAPNVLPEHLPLAIRPSDAQPLRGVLPILVRFSPERSWRLIASPR